MIENIIGLHIGNDIRSSVKKKISKIKKIKNKPNKTFSGNNAFFPILDDFMEIEQIGEFVNYKLFSDYQSMHLRRNDKSHWNGVREYDISLTYIPREKNDNLEKVPQYYVSPTKVEYLNTNDFIDIKLKASKYINDVLTKSLEIRNVAYLGTRDSLITIQKL